MDVYWITVDENNIKITKTNIHCTYVPSLTGDSASPAQHCGRREGGCLSARLHRLPRLHRLHRLPRRRAPVACQPFNSIGQKAISCQ